MILSQVYSYVPDIKNDYNCDFSKTKICNDLWQKMKDWHYSQYDAHNFKLTLDNRWEGELNKIQNANNN